MWTSEKAILREYDIRLFVPLVSRESLIGVLFLAAPERGSEYTGEDMDVLQSLGTSSAIAIDNARMYDRAKRQAKTDELTGLLNRRSFYEDLEEGVERARTEGTNLALILLDIDMFKLFNDMHGSYEGDLALRRVGRMVQSLVGMEGTAYRYGGQEFTVFLPCADGHRAHTVAELIRRSVEDDFLHHEDQTKRFLTVSAGVSVFPVTAKMRMS
jgi:diguanylate cyclase (GGDEF)-like protein